MLLINNLLNDISAKKTDERVRIEEKIKKTDNKIDEIVYALYNITENEKKTIELSLRQIYT